MMYYYHGSNKLFDKFDLINNQCIHLSPHKKYAIDYAYKKVSDMNEGTPYLYTIKIKNQEPNMIYKESMQNVIFGGDKNIEIVSVEEIKN